MGRKHRTYTKEFKLDVLELHANSGKSMAQIERELDLGSTSMSRWKKEFDQEGEEAFPGKGNLIRLKPCMKSSGGNQTEQRQVFEMRTGRLLKCKNVTGGKKSSNFPISISVTKGRQDNEFK